jgi:hypothetical protein
MNAKPFLAVFLLAGVPMTHAGQVPSKVEVTTSNQPDTTLNINPAPEKWNQVITKKSETPQLQIGHSNYVVSGVLVEGLSLQRSSQEQSLGKKLLNLPIVRLFVPRPMPSPSANGSYFRWRDSDRPWTAIAQTAIADRPFDEAAAHEPGIRLISFHR